MGTTSVLPRRLRDAFRLAAEAGFDGIEVMITEKGDEKGWGKGETTAITANFKSVSAVLAPTLLARAYASAPGTGAPMFLCAVMTALSEGVFRMR